MIVGLRSVLLCSKVEHRPDGAAVYTGILGADVYAQNRPGIVECWLTVQVELDRKATSGALEVACAGLSQTFPFETPAGYGDATLALPLIIPVLKVGRFRVSVLDDAAPSAPRTMDWRLQFAPGAKAVAAKDAGERITAVVQQAAQSIAAQMERRGGKTH